MRARPGRSAFVLIVVAANAATAPTLAEADVVVAHLHVPDNA